MKFTVLTLFPEMFPGTLGHGLMGKALGEKWQLEVVNIRGYATDKHHTVDDTPYGGGAGMVLKPDVLEAAIEDVLARATETPLMCYPSPRGVRFTQRHIPHLTHSPHVVLLCGRYEGVDQRVLDHYRFLELSLGDFILNGGESAALAIIEACVRTLSGVISSDSSHEEESFSCGDEPNLLEYPHFTRPALWKGHAVPEVLTAGNHANIHTWRREQREHLTQKRRPDLWKAYKKKET